MIKMKLITMKIIFQHLQLAETIEQLEQEVETLKSLEAQAAAVLRSGTDTKWRSSIKF